MLGLQSLIRRHSEEVKRAFVSHETCLTPDMLLNLIPLKTPQHMLDVQAYRWFLLYIGDRDTTGTYVSCLCKWKRNYHIIILLVEYPGEATLEEILQFCTGLEKVPPMGIHSIKVEYIRDVLPRAAACFNVMRLPTSHNNYEEFCAKMDIGIKGSLGHYGVSWAVTVFLSHFWSDSGFFSAYTFFQPLKKVIHFSFMHSKKMFFYLTVSICMDENHRMHDCMSRGNCKRWKGSSVLKAEANNDLWP